ncbi:MAG: sulfatase-like hydrolase/transferase, partial [Sulfurospirillaceae bacterium]|nr:sulfatase-like hydrolase/transferase [Sulfurospirillaceae bacterium]
YGGKEFDEILLQGLQESIEQTHEDTLIVLHQEGSHGPTYYKRYPDNFKKFTPTCDTQDLEKCSQEQIVNTYDNTILYTDFVINEAIKLLEKNEKNYQTSLFYVSDHGESLGENGVYLHGIPYFIAPEAQKHVPALFYLGNGNENLKKLIAKKTEKFSHDNLFHTILGVFKVQTSEYNPKLDIITL